MQPHSTRLGRKERTRQMMGHATPHSQHGAHFTRMLDAIQTASPPSESPPRSAMLRVCRSHVAQQRCPATARSLLVRCLSSDASSSASAAASTAGAAGPTPVNAAAVAARRAEMAARPSAKEASSEGAQRSFALRLFKALLRAHRTVLPEAMRSLGDAYVREEFKLHKTAKPQHLHGFFTQWIQCQSQAADTCRRECRLRESGVHFSQCWRMIGRVVSAIPPPLTAINNTAAVSAGRCGSGTGSPLSPAANVDREQE